MCNKRTFSGQHAAQPFQQTADISLRQATSSRYLAASDAHYFFVSGAEEAEVTDEAIGEESDEIGSDTASADLETLQSRDQPATPRGRGRPKRAKLPE